MSLPSFALPTIEAYYKEQAALPVQLEGSCRPPSPHNEGGNVLPHPEIQLLTQPKWKGPARRANYNILVNTTVNRSTPLP